MESCKLVRVIADTRGNVILERSDGRGGTYRCHFVYRPDLPEGDYWGNCPLCWEKDGVLTSDGTLYNNRENWAVCYKHKTKWFFGENLLSGWCDLSEEELLRQHYVLAGFRRVESVGDYRSTAECIENTRRGLDPVWGERG